MAVSRILFLHGFPRIRRSFLSRRLRGESRLRGMRLLPGSCPACAKPARHQAPCYVLHHMGFFVPRHLRAGRWALTPPFHPYPVPPRGENVAVLFSVTLSVAPDFHPTRPRILRGMLPGGVRTFLSAGRSPRSDRLPPAKNVGRCEAAGKCAMSDRKRAGVCAAC